MIAEQDKAYISPAVHPAGRLKGKVALITNGSRGIGLAIAKAYVREGAKVVIASPVASDLKIALDELGNLGGDATATKIELNSQAACEMLYNGALRSYGRIDILVNIAGVVGPMVPLINYSAKDWDEVLRINLDVIFWLTKATLGTMIPSNGGCIINVTAAVGQRGRARWGAYSVAKAGVENMSQVLAEEVGVYNIRVNCVDPGATSGMDPEDRNDSLPSADDLVNPFIYLASDISSGTTGMHVLASDWIGRTF